MKKFSQDILCNGLVFPECLRWRDGRLWFVDMYDGKLMSLITGQAAEMIFSKDTMLGGIGWLPDGSLILNDKKSRQIVDTDGQPYADLSSHHHAPINDLIALEDGTLFIGEYGFEAAKGEKFAKANLYRVSPDRQISVAADGLAFPNGMAVSTDKRTLFIAESYAQRITAFDISQDGELSNRRTFSKFKQGNPDGISIDRSGRIWAAMIGTKSIVRMSLDGTPERELSFDLQPYDVEVGKTDEEIFVGLSGASFDDLAKKPLPRTGKIVKVSI